MKNDLYTALQYLRDDRTQKARQILVDIIQSNQKNPQAWFLLSFAVKNNEHKRDCLKRVLAINPNHIKAKQRLAKLTDPTTLRNKSDIAIPILDDVVERWFEALNFRERIILRHLYLNADRFTIEAVGRIVSVSTKKAEQIHQRAIDKLQETISSNPTIAKLFEFLDNFDESLNKAELSARLRQQFILQDIDPTSIILLVSKVNARNKTIGGNTEITTNSHKGTILTTSIQQETLQPNVLAESEDNTPISILNLSKRSFNALQRVSVKTIGQLLALYPAAIWEVKNIGTQSIDEITTRLQNYLEQNSKTHLSVRITTNDHSSRVVFEAQDQIEDEEKQPKTKAYNKEFVPLLQDKTSITSLKLNRRTYNAVFRSGISTIGQLVALSPKELWQIKNIGEKSVEEIDERLTGYLREHEEIPVEQNATDQETDNPNSPPTIDLNLLKEVPTAKLTRIHVTRLGLSDKKLNNLARLGIDSIDALLDNLQESASEETVINHLNYYLAWLIQQPEERLEEEIKGVGISPIYQRDLAQTTIATLFDQWLNVLKERARQIVAWRFGLFDEPLTLQEIGEHIQITRERVRQIEKLALSYIRDRYASHKSKQFRPFLTFLHQLFLHHGGLLSQSEIIELLEKEEVVRLGNINPLGVFLFICEIDEHFSFYKREEFAALSTYSVDTISQVQGCYKDILSKRLTGVSGSTLLKDFRKSSVYQDLESILPEEFFKACLRVHPEIEKLKSGLYSLSKASSKRLGAIVTAMREMAEPAHYSVIAERTNALLPAEEQFTERALHAKLGQHPDVFVWTRLRGTYGLKEWGLEQGLSYVDAIENIFLEENRPLTFEQVIQRLPKYRKFFDEGSVTLTLGTHEKFKSFYNNTYGLSHWNTSKSDLDFGDMFGEQLAQRQLELDRRNNNADIDTQSEVEKIRRIGLDFFTS